MDWVERWIRQKMASAVAQGIGQWATSTKSGLGKPIYQVSDGPVMLVLSELGFSYIGPTPAIECRYVEVEEFKLASLTEIADLHGDLGGMLQMSVIFRDAPKAVEMRWPLRIYSNVATVLDRIVRKLA